MPKQGTVLVVQMSGDLMVAVRKLAEELRADPDVLASMTDAEVARRLIAHGIKEHRKGRGPWPSEG